MKDIDPIKEFGDPFANSPPLLKFGYVNESEYGELEAAAATDSMGDMIDPMAFAQAAKALCEYNIPLYHSLFLDKDPMSHMPGLFKETEDKTRMLFAIARSHSKSDTLVIADAMHGVTYGIDPESDIELLSTLILQENSSKAEETVQSMQIELTRGGPNGLLKAAFGSLKDTAIKWTSNTIWLEGESASKDPTLTGSGAKAALTGGHPKRVLGDDIVSTKNSETPHLRAQMWKWWLTTPEGMFDPDTQVRLTYTPKFGDDLHARIAETGKYAKVMKPALNRMPTEADYTPVFNADGDRIWVTMTEEGMDIEALWPCPFGTGRCLGPKCAGGKVSGIPLHRSVEYIIHDKLLGMNSRREFMQEFMMEITPEEEIVIHPDMMRFWSSDPSKWGHPSPYNEHPVVPLPDRNSIVMIGHAWDHAISDKARADNTAVAAAYRDRENNVYFRVRAGKWDFPTVKRMMSSHYETDPIGRPSAIITEDIGMQKAFGQEAQASSSSILPIIPLSKLGYRMGKGKLDSMLECGYLTGFTNGQVFFQLEDRDTIDEHIAFTGGKNQGMHDDRVDACRMAWAYIRSRAGGKAKVYRPKINRTPYRR